MEKVEDSKDEEKEYDSQSPSTYNYKVNSTGQTEAGGKIEDQGQAQTKPK
eukprot:CAMPEP_0205814440 /NCGR_PEP_ID=MMETSP0205-20121125/19577_1 /ASSEMBLY_ACC=CAM_ASM_000278 /TAXON_ID=36767 /ORGANISM="Euplotes focardii, Strain TN1" /LENGTH=49 /DNA_ID=CAMNT_0053098487 /DNA_START=27 /DNA_END=176 /DNA_ORIENTATION=+